MHLLIPFAAPLSEAGRQAAATLALPNLRDLLTRWAEVKRDAADAWSLSPPHERALALALGWQGGSGQLPWASRAARADGIDPGEQAWGLVTPAHWHLGTDQISLLDPATLLLDDSTSRALFAAVSPLFLSEGYGFHYGAPQRWYLTHESLGTLATASLDRVVGRNVDGWLGKDPGARALRRLQSEVQMLLYTHPINDERVARGLLPVNSFWLSGCGPAQPEAGVAPQVDGRLRAPALADDWAAWVKAWDTLDAGPLATLRECAENQHPAALTLCGERAWVRYETAPGALWRRARALLTRPSPPALMETL